MSSLGSSEVSKIPQKLTKSSVDYWRHKVEKYVKKTCFAPFVLLDRPKDYCNTFVSHIAANICDNFVYSTWNNPEKIYEFPLEECPAKIVSDLNDLRVDLMYRNVEFELCDWKAFLISEEKKDSENERDDLGYEAFEMEYRLDKQFKRTEATYILSMDNAVDFSEADIDMMSQYLVTLKESHSGLQKIAVRKGKKVEEDNKLHPMYAELRVVLEDVLGHFAILLEQISQARKAWTSMDMRHQMGGRSARIQFMVNEAMEKMDKLIQNWKREFPKKKDQKYLHSAEYFLKNVKIQFKVLHSLERIHNMSELHHKIVWQNDEVELLKKYINQSTMAEGALAGVEGILRRAYVAQEMKNEADGKLPTTATTEASPE